MNAYERVFVVENNFDGQLHQILLSEEPVCGGQLVSVARCNGMPLTAAWIARANPCRNDSEGSCEDEVMTSPQRQPVDARQSE